MSKVKLRSRCYKLSRAETANLCNQSIVKHNLRSNALKNEKKIDSKILSKNDNRSINDNIFEEVIEINHLPLLADRSHDNCAVETSSLESQSTSQMSSGLSLESVDFCKWEDCGHDFLSFESVQCSQSKAVMSDELEKHLLECHVKSQLTSKRKYFQCLWIGCKVHKQKSLSYSWLERHVIDHTDNKSRPFSCIFDCHLRFASQLLLEKHVQTHIDSIDEDGTIDALNSMNETNVHLRSKKAFSVNRKSTKQLNSYHVHRSDFIDFNNFTQIRTNTILQNVSIPPGLLEKFNLQSLHQKPPPKALIRLMSIEFKVMGRRVRPDCQSQVLVEWIQPYSLRTESEWIEERLLQLAECLSQRNDSR